jgi:LEA14-like dessication related protein
MFSKLISHWTSLSDPKNGLLVSPGDVKMQTNISEAYAHGEVMLSVRFDNSDQMKIVQQKIRKGVPSKMKSGVVFQFEGAPGALP